MQIETQATIISAESRPYNIDGNEGVSHKVRLLIGTEIFACRATKSLVDQCTTLTETLANVTLDLKSPRETLQLHLESVSE